MSKKKISSYQKMKLKYEAEIQSLRNDIVVLVTSKNDTELAHVRLNWLVTLSLEKQVMDGIGSSSNMTGLGNYKK